MLLSQQTHLQSDAEPSGTASTIVTLLPLVFLFVMFLVFMQLLRRTRARGDEALQLTRDMLTELRAIRAAIGDGKNANRGENA